MVLVKQMRVLHLDLETSGRERVSGPDVDFKNLKATPSDTPPPPKPHLPILLNSYQLRLNMKAWELVGGILIQTTFQLSLIIALFFISN